MTTVIVTHEDNEVDEFDFDNGPQVISIGRRSTNDVCIPNLSVSGMHARLTIEDNIARIEDNNSTNGTYVNGRLISRQLLNDGDEIVIGKTRVMVHLARNNLQQKNVAQNDIAQSDVEQNDEPPVLTTGKAPASQHDDLDIASDLMDLDSSFVPGSRENVQNDQFDDAPMSLSEKAKLALGRQDVGRQAAAASTSASAISASMASDIDSVVAEDNDTAVAQVAAEKTKSEVKPQAEAHPLDGIEDVMAQPTSDASQQNKTAAPIKTAGAVIEIQNGAKSGQILPIDKPVTTLGRPGIQIAAIMRKPDGYFLMHIESDDSVDMPTLNQDTIGDEPVMLQSGDRLNVAGIDVEFMLS